VIAGARVDRPRNSRKSRHLRDRFLDLAAMLAPARQCPPSVDGSPSDVDAPVMPPASLDYATAGAVLSNWQAIQRRESNGPLVVGYDTAARTWNLRGATTAATSRSCAESTATTV